MPSILFVSTNIETVESVKSLATGLNCRVRITHSLDSANQWLAMQKFDIVLSDAVNPDVDPLLVLVSAWNYNPVCLGIVFDLNGSFKETWHASVLGAEVFSGDSAFFNLEKCISSLPERFLLAEKNHFAVLFVEDLDSPRDIICTYIESLGYPMVEGVDSAERAMQTLVKNPYKYFAVITDILMPKVNGIELIREIRYHLKLSFLPCIVLTSVPTSENLIECLKAGASGFLAKPPKKSDLKKELEKAKRMVIAGLSPRLCEEYETHLFEDILRKQGMI